MSNLERQQRQRRFDAVKHTVRKFEGLFEVGLLGVIYYFIWRNYYDIPGMHRFYGDGKYLLAAVYAVLTFILFFYGDSFKFGHIKLADAVISQWIAIIIVNVITYFQLCLIANRIISFLPILLLTGINIALIFILCYIFTAIYHSYCIPKEMIMIYGTKNAVPLRLKMNTRKDKYKIKKMLNCNNFSFDEIVSEISEYDAVVINDVDAQIRNDLLKFCYKNSIRTYLVPKISDIIYSGGSDITLFDTPLKLVKGMGLTPAEKFLKRTFDLLLCTIALIPTLPITLLVAAAIKIEDGGSVFYRQKRITIDGKEFEILKFRSMIENAEADGKPHPATDNDSRITKVGKIIRACRIDELPQIFNILKGDMSIVGPRPERVEHCKKYGAEIPEFDLRNKVKGGLTGFAQIYGKYNTSALDKLKLDLMYIENYSIMLDIKLVLMTVRILFKKESTEGFSEQRFEIEANKFNKEEKETNEYCINSK